MSKNRKRGGRGRPRKAGARFPGGKLKPAGPNQLVVERRKALCADITKASCPLDAAHANGWISPAEYATGKAVVRLNRAANPFGPSGSISQRRAEVPEPEITDDWRPKKSDAELTAIWDAYFNEPDPVELADKEKRQIKARQDWLKVVAAMSTAQLQEVYAVCILESWPQWIVQRAASHMDTKWEAKREMLISGLAAIRSALQPKTVAPACIDREPVAKTSETTFYVDEDGNTLLEVVKIRRRT